MIFLVNWSGLQNNTAYRHPADRGTRTLNIGQEFPHPFGSKMNFPYERTPPRADPGRGGG